VSAEPAPRRPVSFGARAARGTLWTGLRYAAEYSIRLGSNLILTRLLFPEAFGVMALVNALMVGLAMFSDIGLATSVVQSARGDDPRFLRTAWTLQVLRGFLLWAVAAALAIPMAIFYEHEELALFIPAAGLTALLGGFNSIALLRMQRHLELGRLAAIELITQVLSVGIMITWAYLVPSVWALVGGGVAGAALKLMLSHLLTTGERARFAWEPWAARHILHFGKWIFLSTILAFLVGQADRLLFGKLLTVALLGVYGIALVIAGLPIQLFWSLGNFVLLPAFSRHAATPASLIKNYRKLQLPLLILGGLPIAGLVACGPELIELLYDPRYGDAGWMLQLLALGVWLQVPQTLSGTALLAVGQPRWVAVGNAMKLLGMGILVPAGYAVFDVRGAIGGLAIAEAFRWGTFVFAMGRRGLPTLAVDLGCTLLLGAVALAGYFGVDSLRGSGFSSLERLLAGGAGLLAVWIPAAAMLLRDQLPGAWTRFRESWAR
jgi:O-antigen/teichoic acid export membrane protein